MFPRSLGEFLGLVADGRRPFAGGTDLVPRAWQSPEEGPLVWVGGVEELRVLEIQGTSIEIGAGVTYAELLCHPRIPREVPALADAAAVVGSVQIRNVASVVGNVCNASPAADTVPALTVHRAQVLLGGRVERRVDLCAFLTGPGRTALSAGEAVLGLRVSALGPREGSAYRRFTVRRAMDLAFVGVAARLRLAADGQQVEDAAIALGAVGPTVIVADSAAKVLVGSGLEDSVLRECGERVAAQARPISDLRASAEYRRLIAKVLAQDVVRVAYRRARRRQAGPADSVGDSGRIEGGGAKR